ncbi:MAG: UbiA-like polyprenyltransferase [Nitrospinota bacterium]
MNSKLRVILDDIKIQHTLFSLPFAVLSAFLAAEGIPDPLCFFWIIVALTGARSAAMVFNRMVDKEYDRENPRTTGRGLPSGGAGLKEYGLFLLGSVALFEFSCYMLNPLAFWLSPFCLFILFFYSFTKRFTVYSHFALGLALGIAPVGAWVAVKEEISVISIILMLAVVFWLAGLDIIYSCQDEKFDRGAGLYSIPARFGLKQALLISSRLHIVMIGFMILLFFLTPLGEIYLLGLLLATLMLLYEHSLVHPDDITRVNVAFFNVNGLISVELAGFTIWDLLSTRGC